MRFIVDLFRYIIVGLCGFAIIGAVVLVLAALDPANAASDWLSGAVVIGVVVALAMLVINLGVVATLISLHDRHCDLVEEIATANQALARIADQVAHDGVPDVSQ